MKYKELHTTRCAFTLAPSTTFDVTVDVFLNISY